MYLRGGPAGIENESECDSEKPAGGNRGTDDDDANDDAGGLPR